MNILVELAILSVVVVLMWMAFGCEIIGNIHDNDDNPELLEV